MRDIRVATAQFEHRNNDKAYNLARIEDLTRRAVEKGRRDRQLSRMLDLRLHVSAASEPRRAGGPRRARARRAVDPRARADRPHLRRRRHGRADRSRRRRPVSQLLCNRRPRRFHHQVQKTPHVHQSAPEPRRFLQRDRPARREGRLLDLLRQQPARERADHHHARGRGDLHAARHRLPSLDHAGPRNRRSRTLGESPAATRFACGRSSTGPRGAAGSCGGCRRGRGKTASTPSSATRSASTTIRSSPGWP